MISYHQKIRKEIRQQRDQLSKELQIEYSQLAANHLIQSDLFKKSQHIACYIKFGTEIDPEPILKKALELNKTCYLPVIDTKEYGKMYFVAYREGDELVKSRFGILEPLFHFDKIITPEKLDLVILPLTAFDKKGNRIGTGGGYYDRAFQFSAHKSSQYHPILCGIGYSLQEINDVKPNSWDIALDAVTTEKKLVKFKNIYNQSR